MKPNDHGNDSESAQAYENVFLRKGSIAAFTDALRRYDRAKSGSPEAACAAIEIEALLETIKSLGVLDVFTPRSERARTLLRSLDPDLPL